MAIRGKYKINQPSSNSIFKRIKNAVNKTLRRPFDSETEDTSSESNTTISMGSSIRSSTSSVTPIKVKLYSLDLALDM